MAIAEHSPEKLYARNAGLASMGRSKLREFTRTKRSGLPQRIGKKH